MKRAVLALGVSLLVAVPAFAQTNVAGDWEVTLIAPTGQNTFTAVLKQDGTKIQGTLKGPQGELPFQEGTLTGDELKFAFTVNFQGNPLPITLTGKVKGDTIDGKADFGGMAEGDWSAKRPGAATAAAPAAAAPAGAPATTVAVSAGADGKWDVTFMTPQGEFPATAMLKNSSGKLSGTFGSQMGEVPVTGTVEGKTIKFTINAQTPQGDMSIALSGDVEGDSIVNGTAEIAGMGQMSWSAKRAKQ